MTATSGPEHPGPGIQHHPGATLATVAVTLTPELSSLIEQAGEWEEGPLPVVFEAPAGTRRRADAAARASYFPREIGPVLYGSAAQRTLWPVRRHRYLRHTCPPAGHVQLHYVGLEHHRVTLDGLSSSVLVLHLDVVPTEADALASDGEADLACLSAFLLPSRRMNQAPPAELAQVLGLEPSDLTEVLADTVSWFTVLRTARTEAEVRALVRGAATGSAPAAANITDEQLVDQQVGRLLEPSRSWVCEIGTRGLGFVRRLERREEDRTFFDVSGPAYTRSVYFDIVHLVGLQNELLGSLRAKVGRTELPTVGGGAGQYESVLALQRATASYRIRLWWSSIGRGGWQESAFRLLQSDWDLRARLGDVEAEAASLADLVRIVAEQEAQLQREWSRRTSATFSVLLAGVAALAIPQTLLAAVAVGVDREASPLLRWLPDSGVLAQLAAVAALAVAVAMASAVGYACFATAQARGRRQQGRRQQSRGQRGRRQQGSGAP